MKKLTCSVLAVVLSSSFALVSAQQRGADTVKTSTIQEVVITGALGIKRTADATTSAQQVVNSEQLTQAANPNAVSALTGKVSGVQITQTNTSVTGTNSIIIRGARTITGSNEALVVIDNVISSATVLQQLPPEAIESINIIKGGAGAALYGSQGINGVVVVTTKRGTRTRKLTATLNSTADFETIAFMPLRQREYGQGWDGDHVAVENGGWGPAFGGPLGGTVLPYGIPLYDYDGDGEINVNPNGPEATADTPASLFSVFAPYGKNNVKDFFQTGSLFQNTLTVNAGDSNAYVLMSLNNVEREFVVEDDILKRTAAIFKGGIKLDRWRFDGNVNYIRQKTSVTDSDIYYQLLQSASDIPITAFRDYANRDRAYAWNIYYQNPYWSIKHDRRNALRNYVNMIGSVEFEVNNHISLSYRGNMQITALETDNHGDGWSDVLLPEVNTVTSYYNKGKSNTNYYYGDLLANFDYDLTDDLNLKFLLGHNYQEWRIDNSAAGGTGIIIPGQYQVWNLSNPSLPYNLDNRRFFKNMHAGLANLDLSFRNYLFLNAAGRYELSSVLPSDNRSYFFPSVSASFVPTKAFDGFKSKALSYVKVTAAFQRTGNTSAIGYYDALPRMALAPGFPYLTSGPTKGALSFIVDQSPTDVDIKPEFTTKKEIGLTLGFLNDRISFDGSIYREDTDDLITRQSSSYTTGIRSALKNIGKMKNTGFDANLNLIPVRTTNFRWDLGVSYTTNKAVVTKLTEDAKEVRLAGNNFVGVYAIEGQEFPVIKGTTYVRDNQGRIIVDAVTGLPTVSSTLEMLGRVTPKYILGFTTSLRFKGLRASAVMDYRTGHKFYSGTLQGFTFSGMNIASAGFDRTKPYIIPNSSIKDASGNYVPNTSVPIYATTYNNPNNAAYNPVTALESHFGGSTYNTVGENFVIDATAFRVRELALSYSFGKEILGNSKLSDLTIGVHARNPFHKFSKENKGYDDPETAFDPRYRGLANPDQYPNLKTFGGTVSVTF